MMAVVRLGPADMLADGEMKTVETDDHRFLLARVGDAYFATSAKCPHAGASLADGILSGKRVVCPWHHAVFQVDTGALVEPPALEDLASFRVIVEDGELRIDFPEHRAEPAPLGGTSHRPVHVIVGSGPAGALAADSMRRQGFEGRIVMVGDEGRTPYDRTLLSKSYLMEQDPNGYLPLHTEAFYERQRIERLANNPVVRLSVRDRRIDFEDGGMLEYDKVLIATGSAPRRLAVEGADLAGIHALRGVGDADRIFEAAAQARHAVVIGSGFIGMEAAASLRDRGMGVTVVSIENEVMENVLGAEVGAILRGMHEAKGVAFRMESGVLRYEGAERVERVVLDDGTEIAADLVIEGVGVRPATGFVEGLDLRPDGGIEVDERMCAVQGDGSVYAAGDVAAFPFGPDGKRLRIEHWRTAQQTGMRAGCAMAGAPREMDISPFFWTRQYGQSVQYVGFAPKWDRVVLEGPPGYKEFVAYYILDGRILAAAGLKRNRSLCGFSECLRLGCVPDASILDKGPVDWLALLG